VRQLRGKCRRLAALGLVGFCAALPAVTNAERSVILAWDRSPDPNVTGYKAYYLEENAATPIQVNVGTSTQTTISGLKEGLKYTFTVTSYNMYGVESSPSGEVAFVVPVPLALNPPASPLGLMRLRFPVAPGHWYELQASGDLQSWATVWQVGKPDRYAWVEYEDPRGSSFKSQFYRLQIH
jgi:hypothetical protein